MVLLTAATITLFFLGGRGDARATNDKASVSDAQTDANAQRMLDEGKQTFRFDTFGDEAFWSSALQLHQAIAGQNFGGVGPGVSPKTALAVGLKVDSEALPQSLVSQLKHAQRRNH